MISGASTGDYSDSTEMLCTAIAVTKQSQITNDECCCVLISLKRFMALKPSPIVWVPAGALPEKDICSGRNRLASPKRAAGQQEDRDLLLNNEQHDVTSKKGTRSAGDTRIENGAAPLGKEYGWEHFFFVNGLVSLHLHQAYFVDVLENFKALDSSRALWEEILPSIFLEKRSSSLPTDDTRLHLG